jgi:tRNA (adenine37-N6)-methyltransferase
MLYQFEPIGVCRSQVHSKAGLPLQGILNSQIQVLKIFPQYQPQLSLRCLEGFSRIWIIYIFDRNDNWKPLTLPPRAQSRKGVFATRSPYRPNPIGICPAEVVEVHPWGLTIKQSDLLDNTPVLDIKPYIPQYDCFPEESTGWLSELPAVIPVVFEPLALQQVNWLLAKGCALAQVVENQLCFHPTDSKRKRIYATPSNHWIFAYRTWRFEYIYQNNIVSILALFSGYSPLELQEQEDKWQDKDLHRSFINQFGRHHE